MEDAHTSNPFWKQGVYSCNNKGRESVFSRDETDDTVIPKTCKWKLPSKDRSIILGR